MCKAMVGPKKDQIGYLLFMVDLDKFQDPFHHKNQVFKQKIILEFTNNDVIKILS